MCEGLTPYYHKTIFILRPDEGGHKQEIPIELSKLLDRKAEDVELQPEDILYVPDNNGKRVAVNILDRATGFARGTVSGVSFGDSGRSRPVRRDALPPLRQFRRPRIQTLPAFRSRLPDR